MRLHISPQREPAVAGAVVWVHLLTFVLLCCGACDPPNVAIWQPQPVAEVRTPASSSPSQFDHPFKTERRPLTSPDSLGGTLIPVEPAARLEIRLTVLHVQVPRAARASVASLWNHLREDVLDGDVRLRLDRNGVRVGMAETTWWEAVKTVLDSVPDVRSYVLEPVRLPPGFPLALELDTGPHDQTIFYVGDDGILSGQTWPQSRGVLRVSCAVSARGTERVWLTVVPEVRQRLPGWRWVRNEAGLTQVPNYNGRAFPEAGFVLEVASGQFVLVAPSAQADLYGMIGGALLTRTEDGETYDSYVFLRVDVNDVVRAN